MKASSDKLQKNIHLIILSLFGLLIAVFAGYYFWGGSFVPENFTRARQGSIQIAREIVSLSQESLDNLVKIEEADRNYNYKKALSMVNDELTRVQKAQQKAMELTTNLNAMVNAAAGIQPKKARNLAIEAISQQLSLISHLVLYNGGLNALLQTLNYKFSGDINSNSEEVQKIIKGMNGEADEINTLNNLFNQKMEEFDEALK